MQKKIMLVFGTRPEAIKMAPLVKAFQEHPNTFKTFVCVTGQHRTMLDQILNFFEIKPDFDLDIMKPNQDLYDVFSNVLNNLKSVISKITPDLVLVHGDTSTSTAAALCAFYQQIPVAHVEAGLRTNNIYSPWPEEMNRQITSRMATFHFAPTALSQKNLTDENIKQDKILVTGNTVIDALHFVSSKIKADKKAFQKINTKIGQLGYDPERISEKRKLVLITGHRRENLGKGFENICLAIKALAIKHPNVDFLYPVHLNPKVRKTVFDLLNISTLDNVFLIEPLDYLPFVYLMEKSYLILTDSGGIQEEAPDFGKPVLVMRDTTERPEALDAGTVILVGTDKDKIYKSVNKLIGDKNYYQSMSNKANPYGDGKASHKIVNFLLQPSSWILIK